MMTRSQKIVRKQAPVSHTLDTLIDKKLAKTMLLPVRTLDNGDCLFAAFAQARRGLKMPMAMQKQHALKLRAKVVAFMARSSRFNSQWARVDTRVSEADQRRQARVLEQLNNLPRSVYQRFVKNAARGNRHAYAELMSLPGMWGGEPELHALAHMYRVPIVILHGPFKHMHPIDGTRMMRTPFLKSLTFGKEFARIADPVYLNAIEGLHYEALLADTSAYFKVSVADKKKLADLYAKIRHMKRALKTMGIPKQTRRRFVSHAAASNGSNNAIYRAVNAVLG